MRFSHRVTYDAAPDEVARMLADRTFREQVCEAMGSTRCEVSLDGSGSGMRVVVDHTQRATGVPSFARRFVGESIEIIRRESWSSTSEASLRLEIPGKPARLDADIRLLLDGGGTVETVSGDLSVSVPIVGGRIEKLVADLLRSALHTEEKVGRAWLAAGQP